MGKAMIYKLIAVAAAGLAGSVVLVAAGEGRYQADLRPRAAAGAQIATVTPMKPHTGPLPALPRVSFDPPLPMAESSSRYTSSPPGTPRCSSTCPAIAAVKASATRRITPAL